MHRQTYTFSSFTQTCTNTRTLRTTQNCTDTHIHTNTPHINTHSHKYLHVYLFVHTYTYSHTYTLIHQACPSVLTLGLFHPWFPGPHFIIPWLNFPLWLTTSMVCEVTYCFHAKHFMTWSQIQSPVKWNSKVPWLSRTFDIKQNFSDCFRLGNCSSTMTVSDLETVISKTMTVPVFHDLHDLSQKTAERLTSTNAPSPPATMMASVSPSSNTLMNFFTWPSYSVCKKRC